METLPALNASNIRLAALCVLVILLSVLAWHFVLRSLP